MRGLSRAAAVVFFGLTGTAAAQNLLVDPSFSSGLAGWAPEIAGFGIAAYTGNYDADDQFVASGSARVVNFQPEGGVVNSPISQCVDVVAGTTYDAGFKALYPDGQPNTGYVELAGAWHSAPRCGGSYITGFGVFPSSPPASLDVWTGFSGTLTAPAGARSASVDIGVYKISPGAAYQAYVDDVVFAPHGSGTESLIGVLPGAGSLTGAGGAAFKTSVQVTNPGAGPISGHLVVHPAGRSASSSDPRVAFSVAPRQTVAFDDLLPAAGLSGLGSVDVYSTLEAAPPVVTARVFADGGSAGTTGFTEPIFAVPGDGTLEDTLLGPSDTARFRYGMGVRTFGAPVRLDFEVFDADGNPVGDVQKDYPPEYYEQAGAHDFLGGIDLPPNASILVLSTGPAVVYGSTTDNVTNDPSVQFLVGPR